MECKTFTLEKQFPGRKKCIGPSSHIFTGRGKHLHFKPLFIGYESLVKY